MKKFNFAMVALLAATLAVLPLRMEPAKAAEESDWSMYFPTDIDGHWAYDELDNFVVADLMKGYKDSKGVVTIKPDKSVTRAEFVALLVRALGLTSNESGKTFSDVETDQWYYEPVRIASSLGVVNGVSDSEFGPNKLINRGDIATMIVRAFDDTVAFDSSSKALPFGDVPSYYAASSIKAAYLAGIVNGITDKAFKPFANAKRAEAAVMLQRALSLQKTQLPDDGMLKTIVLQSDRVEYDAINNDGLQSLNANYSNYFTAFQLSANRAYGDVLKNIDSEGYTMKAEETSARKLDVTFSTNRFAIVSSTGGAYRFSYSLDGEEAVQNQSNDGLYYMKKMEDNSWKIYAVYQETVQ
ncbi:S-layer homology domain-containing protein [Paenibacillus nanensis]|uniref:S-layer homology domain-containing protein n=1 Tax=Paenibacillus nanensis TaxID=393251 RepID=A0A3A1V332_9BACL|nr:S-layer homology domain-containing protein [Paenibacillus nanensis]RIX52963.1 S-layer homology domain-containing protein [Paenibacillus nanensis]